MSIRRRTPLSFDSLSASGLSNRGGPNRAGADASREGTQPLVPLDKPERGSKSSLSLVTSSPLADTRNKNGSSLREITDGNRHGGAPNTNLYYSTTATGVNSVETNGHRAGSPFVRSSKKGSVPLPVVEGSTHPAPREASIPSTTLLRCESPVMSRRIALSVRNTKTTSERGRLKVSSDSSTGAKGNNLTKRARETPKSKQTNSATTRTKIKATQEIPQLSLPSLHSQATLERTGPASCRVLTAIERSNNERPECTAGGAGHSAEEIELQTNIKADPDSITAIPELHLNSVKETSCSQTGCGTSMESARDPSTNRQGGGNCVTSSITLTDCSVSPAELGLLYSSQNVDLEPAKVENHAPDGQSLNDYSLHSIGLKSPVLSSSHVPDGGTLSSNTVIVPGKAAPKSKSAGGNLSGRTSPVTGTKKKLLTPGEKEIRGGPRAGTSSTLTAPSGSRKEERAPGSSQAGRRPTPPPPSASSSSSRPHGQLTESHPRSTSSRRRPPQTNASGSHPAKGNHSDKNGSSMNYHSNFAKELEMLSPEEAKKLKDRIRRELYAWNEELRRAKEGAEDAV